MLLAFHYIDWSPDPIIFTVGGFGLRYYSLLWIIGLFLGYLVAKRVYRDRGIADAIYDPLFLYCFLGVLIGARLGHCLFYQPDYYLSHFWEMILPVKFLPGGGWRLTGYEGLSSHGGVIGIFIALTIYCKRTGMHFLDVLDVLGIVVPITACCIRLANLMNSEIIGLPTDVPWAFVFHRVDELPRHPAQLYEAIVCFITFVLAVGFHIRGERILKSRPAPHVPRGALITRPSIYHRGFYTGLCLSIIFTFRFFVEFIKEDQVDFEEGMIINMGQWLSIPFAAIGIYFLFFYQRRRA